MLHDISFDLRAGESVALLGASGAGKSTLLRHLNGLLRPLQGRVHINTTDSHTFSVAELSRIVGLLFQNPLHQLFAETVEAEIGLGLHRVWPDHRERQGRIEEVLVAFDLTALRRSHPMRLSEGQRRRVALGAVMAPGPAVLALDEPTLGQDVRQKSRLATTLRHLADAGTVVVVSTHDLQFAASCCERALVLAHGRLLYDGPMAHLFSREALLRDAALLAPQSYQLRERLAAVGYPLEEIGPVDQAREIAQHVRNSEIC